MSDTQIDLPETMHIEGEQPDEHPSGERQKSPREIQMEAIAARAEERRQAELAQSAVYDEDARAAGLAFPEDEAEAAVLQPSAPVERPHEQPQPSAPVVAQPPLQQPQIRTLSLGDGRTYEVTDAQFAQLAQLGMVANIALHQPQAPAYQPEPVEPPKPLIDPTRVRETVKQMQFGDEDAAVAALTHLVTDVASRVPQGPQIDPNAIVTRAVQMASMQAQLANDTAIIRQEYPEIYADPQRTMLARLNVDAIKARNVATGRFQSDLDIYREAGNAVYDALGRSRPGSEVIQPAALQAAQPIRQDVIERKRAAPRATQAIDRRAPAPETPRPPTGSEIVDQMRRQRGQASMR